MIEHELNEKHARTHVSTTELAFYESCLSITVMGRHAESQERFNAAVKIHQEALHRQEEAEQWE